MVEDTRLTQVKELCRRLEPVLGKRAQKYYELYLSENEKGRQELSKQLEIMVARLLRGQLETEDELLIPPGKEQAAGEYNIGDVIYGNKELYPFGLREDEFIQHVAVFGRSGAGKTNIGFNILEQLANHKKPFIVFDWKRNYRDLVGKPGFEKLRVELFYC